jgi:hypothetical protein
MPSTVITKFSYDPDKEMLFVTFISGTVYAYKKVPESVYNDMKAFREKGVFLNTNIKGKYEFEKISAEG